MPDLLSELKRRNVFRIAALYAVFSWLILQVADVAFGVLRMPDWALTLVAVILALGFLPACVFAWIYEMTPDGIRKEADADHDSAAAVAASHRVNVAILVVLVVAVGIFAGRSFLPAGAPTTKENADQPQSEASPRAVEATEPTENAPPDERSIAVLPFVNMSAVAENEYFSDGLTETLLHKLSQLPDLRVAARTSSFAFKGSSKDVREIAGQLDVRHVLEGSVQRAGDRVRITAQLVQADDGFHLWSGTYDRDLDDIFAVQDEIAGEVATALKVSLLGAEQRTDGGTEDTLAYDLYLRGRDAFWTRTEEGLENATRLLNEAVTRDPDFALGWAALAEAVIDGAPFTGQQRNDVAEAAIGAAQRAVELAPELSETVGVLGHVYRELRQNAKALEALERAVALDSNNARALSWLADAQFSDGEYLLALANAQRAMALDPLDYELKAESTYKFIQVNRVDEAEALAQSVVDAEGGTIRGLAALGNVYWRTGRFALAYRSYFRLLELNPNALYVMDRVGDSFENLGDYQSARAWYNRAAEQNPDEVRTDLARLCYVEGDDSCARSLVMQELAEQSDEETRSSLAAWLARIDGDWEEAVIHTQRRRALAEERGSNYILLDSLLDIARDAELAQRPELRAPAVEEARSRLLVQVEQNGSESQYSQWMLARSYAVEGNGPQAAAHLGRAIDHGFRDLPNVLYSGSFDPVLDAPGFIAVVDRLRQVNAEELRALRAVVEELGGPFGP